MARKSGGAGKAKPCKSVRKRVSISRTGKVKFQRTGKRKLMSHKSGDRCRKLGRVGVLPETSAFAKKIVIIATDY